VLEAGGEIVSLLRLDRQAQWWLGRSLPSAQVHQLATPPQHRGAGHGAPDLLRAAFASPRPWTAEFY
jgi:predicted acetyltransferase